MNSVSAFIRSVALLLLLLAVSIPASAGITLPSPKTQTQLISDPASSDPPVQTTPTPSSATRRGEFGRLEILALVLRMFIMR